MITADRLTKRFGDVLAVDAISFQIPAGSITGFVGPNGAGKTTTLRMLATLEEPDSGEAAIDGHSVRRDVAAVRRAVGYMPDYLGAYPHMLVFEYLDFFARAYGLPRSLRARREADVGEFTGLGPLLRRPVSGLSKGQRQRLNLARALLSEPPVLIMDEPAAGLDPRARIELYELLRVLAQRKTTIFISSHILSELSDLVDRVVIIEAGQIRCDRPLAELEVDREGGTLYALEPRGDRAALKRFLLEQKAVRSVEDGEEDRVHVRVDEQAEPFDEVLARLFAAGLRVRQVYCRERRLEDVFMEVTSGRESDVDGHH